MMHHETVNHNFYMSYWLQCISRCELCPDLKFSGAIGYFSLLKEKLNEPTYANALKQLPSINEVWINSSTKKTVQVIASMIGFYRLDLEDEASDYNFPCRSRGNEHGGHSPSPFEEAMEDNLQYVYLQDDREFDVLREEFSHRGRQLADTDAYDFRITCYAVIAALKPA